MIQFPQTKNIRWKKWKKKSHFNYGKAGIRITSRPPVITTNTRIKLPFREVLNIAYKDGDVNKTEYKQMIELVEGQPQRLLYNWILEMEDV